MANRFIGGVLSSKPQANSPFVSRATTGTYFNSSGVLSTATVNQPRLNYSFSGSVPFNRYGSLFASASSSNQTVATGSGNLGTTFTVECWWRATASQANYPSIISQNFTGSVTSGSWAFKSNNASQTFAFSWGSSPSNLQGTTNINTGAWFHLAAVYNGTVLTLYVNGVSEATQTVSLNLGNTGASTYIGYTPRDSAYINGTVYGLRVITGQALYSGTFTPPTGPYTTTSVGSTGSGAASSITGTVLLLTCQTPNAADQSSNNYSISSSNVTASAWGIPGSFTADTNGWVAPNVLTEPTATNLVTYSQDVSNAAWSKAAVSVGATGIAPDGTNTAYLVVPSTSSGQHYFNTSSITFTSGSTAVASCFVKANGYNYVSIELPRAAGGYFSNSFDLTNGTVLNVLWDGGALASGAITPVGNGWYRISILCPGVSTGNFYLEVWDTSTRSVSSWSGNGGSGVYFWGMQVEPGYQLTSYIPTTSTTITRSADIVGPYTTGVFGLDDVQNNTAIDDQYTVTSFTTTGSTTWTAPLDVTSVEVLVVAGGGGGGGTNGGGMGGGGAGGVIYNTSYPVTPGTTYPVTVGAGGAYGNTASRGENSVFGRLIAIGGGGGLSRTGIGGNTHGGSGGGGSEYPTVSDVGSGTTGQGYPGGKGYPNTGGGGGGGAAGPGFPAISSSTAGAGGPGLTLSITGTSVEYGRGGGGSTNSGQGAAPNGGAGSGGTNYGATTNGTANTGMGGGGAYSTTPGNGGSGIVVVKYKRTPKTLSSTQNAAIVVQKFTTSSTWAVPTGVTQVEALVVAGGGAGGDNGGGGAGGLIYNAAYPVTPGGVCSIVIGAGGTPNAGSGSNSQFASSAYNIVTNGTFDTDTGWTHTLTSIANGYMYLNAGSQPRPTSTSLGTSTGSYLLTWTVISNPGGHTVAFDDDGAGAGLGSVTTYVASATAVGTYSAVISKTASPRLRILGSGTFTQSMIFDNVFVYPISSIVNAVGGGGGGNSASVGVSGGSGGGGSYAGTNAGGSGTSGQGNAGGTGKNYPSGHAGGGGGGAGGAGTPAYYTDPGPGGYGGPGLGFNFFGQVEYYAGGGGAGVNTNASDIPGKGGIGGGGNGGQAANGQPGSPNTGGGGGGAAYTSGGFLTGGAGGSGVVILRYRVPQVATFVDSGAWTCPSGVTSVQALIVAGGGGSCGGSSEPGGGGGGGGVIYSSSVSVTPGVTYPVVVGKGGVGTTNASRPFSGENSSFANLIAIGGGAGGFTQTVAGQAGGSGGGGSGWGGTTGAVAGAGTYGQGYAGGAGNVAGDPTPYAAGGGGGAGGPGSSMTTGNSTTGGGGAGGVGLSFSISGTATYYGGGGGGSSYQGAYAGAGGLGGGAGGVRNSDGSALNGINGTLNTGGGASGAIGGGTGGTGGSGIVIIRWYGA